MTQTIIFFDIDETLVRNRFSRKAIRELLDPIADAAEKSVQTIAAEMGAENERRQATDPDNVLTMDWDDIVAQMAAQYGVTLNSGVDELWLKYANADDVEVLDNAPQVLQQLREAGYPLVIATKGLSKYQNPVLEVSALRQYFDDMLTPDITGYLKTSPQYFDKYTAQEATFIQVGDHYYDDVICAKRNGFTSILRAPIDDLRDYDPFDRVAVLPEFFDQIKTYPKAGSDVRPDAVVVSLEEVPQVVGRITKKLH